MKKILVLLITSFFLTACNLMTKDVKNLSTDQQSSIIMEQTEKYVNYSSEKLEELQGQKHVLFFHANWCSWCRVRDKKILRNLDTLPENTRIIKVNFDEEEELRAKYGVKTKDQFTFINEDGTFETRAGAGLDIVTQFFTDGTVSKAESPVSGTGGYWAYDPKVVETFIGKKPYMLFFHAQWCGSCRAIDKKIRENLETLPANTAVFKLDYDIEKELGKKYEVKSQHTAVFFDKEGTHVKNVQGFGLDEITNFFK